MSARDKASELEKKVQILIAQKDEFDRVIQAAIGKVGSATESGIQRIVDRANAEAEMINGLAQMRLRSILKRSIGDPSRSA
jgi:hypothetical protein